MHHCLEIPEILANICQLASGYSGKGPDELEGDDFYLCGSRALLALAQVCAMFLEPSLDALWNLYGSLSRLVMLLPSDAWHMIGGGNHPKLVSFRTTHC
jgi:hypothetical protein